jgi:ribosome maturation factor RimP
MTPAEAKLAALIEPELTKLGFELVRLSLMSGAEQTLQIMTEKPDGTINLDECATVSRHLSEVLDAADPLAEAYTLEVSSPGIDRPLTRPKDFERWQGFDAKIELIAPVNGQKRFAGKLGALSDGVLALETKDGAHALALADIAKAKLVLTDALIAAALKRGTAHQPAEDLEFND